MDPGFRLRCNRSRLHNPHTQGHSPHHRLLHRAHLCHHPRVGRHRHRLLHLWVRMEESGIQCRRFRHRPVQTSRRWSRTHRVWLLVRHKVRTQTCCSQSLNPVSRTLLLRFHRIPRPLARSRHLHSLWLPEWPGNIIHPCLWNIHREYVIPCIYYIWLSIAISIDGDAEGFVLM